MPNKNPGKNLQSQHAFRTWDRQNKLFLEVSFKLLLKIPDRLNTSNHHVLKCCSGHKSLMFKVTVTVEDPCPLQYVCWFQKMQQSRKSTVSWKALSIEGLKLHPTCSPQNFKKESFASWCNEPFALISRLYCILLKPVCHRKFMPLQADVFKDYAVKDER